MAAQPGHTQLNAHLTDEAYEKLRGFCAEHRVSMVVFLEALALRLDPDRMSPWLREVVKDAGRMDSERRRRKPKEGS